MSSKISVQWRPLCLSGNVQKVSIINTKQSSMKLQHRPSQNYIKYTNAMILEHTRKLYTRKL